VGAKNIKIIKFLNQVAGFNLAEEIIFKGSVRWQTFQGFWSKNP
jgi:hypothetical protein